MKKLKSIVKKFLKKKRRVILSVVAIVISFIFIISSWGIIDDIGGCGGNDSKEEDSNEIDPSALKYKISTEIKSDIKSSTDTSYNQLKIPQFQTRAVEGTLSILNGGIGNGTNQSFFCSGKDEAKIYNSLVNGSNTYDPNISNGANKGTYNVVRLIDRCRIEGGCADVQKDQKFFVIGVPTHATHCHPWGLKKNWEDPIFNNPPQGGENSSTTPLGRYYSAWQNRNRIMTTEDEGFLYSRYLIKQVDRSEATGSLVFDVDADDLKIELINNNIYSFDSATPYFLDIPWAGEHLKWGFTCAEISKKNGYKSNPEIKPWENAGWDNAIRQGWLNHQKEMLQNVVSELGNRIKDGVFGNLKPSKAGKWELLDTKNRQMVQSIVSIWNILKTMVDDVTWEHKTKEEILERSLNDLESSVPQGQWGKSNNTKTKKKNKIYLYSVQTKDMPDGAIINYQAGSEVISIAEPIVEDCLSGRAKGTKPTLFPKNPESGDPLCTPSYGLFHADGLYEIESNTGYSLFDGGDTITASPGIYRSADGYSYLIASLLAHQLVHAYFQRKNDTNKMNGWPLNPTALREEELAVMAQAVVFRILADLDYASSDFTMIKSKFIKNITTNSEGKVSGSSQGFRFHYPDSPRGYSGIFLGPFFANMNNIYRNLAASRPETARMLALYHALAPTLKPPKFMTINGNERSFELFGVDTGSGQ